MVPVTMLTLTLTLMLTEEQAVVLAWEAAAYKVTPAERLAALVQPLISEMSRRHRETQWQTRRRVLEADAQLAAVVDRAGER